MQGSIRTDLDKTEEMLWNGDRGIYRCRGGQESGDLDLITRASSRRRVLHLPAIWSVLMYIPLEKCPSPPHS